MHETDDTSEHAQTRRLHERYTVVRELGRGTQGTLALADDAHTGARVAIKELDLKLVDEWKAVELFEREARALESLAHPGIPSYVDSFHERQPDGSDRFYLVQQYIDGTPLSEQIDTGELMDEAAAREFLREMLSILDYMQTLNPPVVHRDIKPSNIIVRPDGTHALVDFGAVQTVLPETVGGSTVVGTTGFMPPEQLMGRATPASDIYALGATIVYAMTGVDPADLDLVRMKLQFHEVIDASERFVHLLDRMLEPAVENRLADSAAVLAVMRDPADAAPVQSQVPSGSAMVAWEATAQAIAEIERNPPRPPLSIVTVEPERLLVEVGPIEPPARNWWVPVIVMVLAIIIGALSGGCLLVLTLPAGIYLIVKGMGYLRPVSERLEMTPHTLTLEKIEHKRLGEPAVDTHTFAVDQLYLPHVHRIRVDSLDGGRSLTKGRRTMEAAKLAKPGKPGLIFTDQEGETAAFGSTILTQHRFIQVGMHDDEGELDWLDEIVTEYMTYVRGGGPDE